MLDKLISFIIRFHRWLFVFTLVVTAVLAFWFLKVRVATTTEGNFPPKDDPERIYYQRTIDTFGNDYSLIVVISHDDIFSYSTLNKIRQLTSEFERLPRVDRVESLTNAVIVKSQHDEIYLNDISEKVPTDTREIKRFRKDILENPIYERNLISKDERATIIHIVIDWSEPFEVARESMARIEKIAKSAEGPEKISITGLAQLDYAVYKSIFQDLKRFLPLTMVLIAIVMFLNFRSIWCVIISIIFIFMGVEWTYSFMSISNEPISYMATTLTPVLAVVGLSNAVHLFTEYFRRVSEKRDIYETVRNMLRDVLLPIWLKLVTTAIGFASLTLVNIDVIKKIGIFLTIGTLAVLFLTTFFIPPVLILFHPKRRTKIEVQSVARNVSTRFIRSILRYRLHVFVLTGAFTIASVYGVFKLVVNTDTSKYFRKSSEINRASELVSSRFKSISSINVFIEGQKEGSLESPELLRSIETLQEFLDGQPEIAKTVSIVDYLKLINRTFHDNNQHYYTLPKSKEEIAQYLFAYSLADPHNTLSKFIDDDHKFTKVTLRTAKTDTVSIVRLKKLIEDACAKYLSKNISWGVTSNDALASETVQSIAHQILISFASAGIAITAIMLLLFRSLKMGIVSMVPNVLPIAYILGLMSALGIAFNMGNSLVICVAIGIAVDDTIHYMVRFFYELKRSNHYLARATTGIKITEDQIQSIILTYHHVGRPIVTTAVAVTFGFIILAFSQLVPIVWYGVLTAATMVIATVCELILLPAILASVEI